MYKRNKDNINNNYIYLNVSNILGSFVRFMNRFGSLKGEPEWFILSGSTPPYKGGEPMSQRHQEIFHTLNSDEPSTYIKEVKKCLFY